MRVPHRLAVVTIAAAMAAAVTPAVAGSSQLAAAPRVREVTKGLSIPWAIAFLPNRQALVTERDNGRLLLVGPAGRVTVLGKIAGVRADGEGGLLGVAVSRTFSRDRWVYLYYSSATDNRIVRLPYRQGRLGRQQVIVRGIPKGGNHNGGRLAFGPDGMLYATTGEVGNPRLSQDLRSLGGKILRVTPTGRPAPGNPFRTRIWAYGLRDPQGLAWDRRGRLFATEFGEDRWDEVNLIKRGGNYGWPIVEGPGGPARFVKPLVVWRPANASPSGLGIMAGSLWVAALRGERLWRVPIQPNGSLGRPRALFVERFGRIRAAVPAPDGTLWITTSNRDQAGNPRPGGDRILSVTP